LLIKIDACVREADRMRADLDLLSGTVNRPALFEAIE
jgi:hypothetical protein